MICKKYTRVGGDKNFRDGGKALTGGGEGIISVIEIVAPSMSTRLLFSINL